MNKDTIIMAVLGTVTTWLGSINVYRWWNKSAKKKDAQEARMTELQADDKQYDLYERQILFFEQQLEKQAERFIRTIEEYERQIQSLKDQMEAQKKNHEREKAEMLKELKQLREMLKDYKN